MPRCGMMVRSTRFPRIACLPFLHLLLAIHLFQFLGVHARSVSTRPFNLTTTTRVQCVGSESWLAPNFVKEDCYVAVQNLYKYDYRFHPNEVFTFFSGGFAPIHRSMMVQTPRRYVECEFVPSSLCQDYGGTDVLSFSFRSSNKNNIRSDVYACHSDVQHAQSCRYPGDFASW